MIQSGTPTVLYINKLSVLLVSSLLLLLWVGLEVIPSIQQPSKSIDVVDSKNSKYLKTLTVNPFLRMSDDIVTNDTLPTVTALQSKIPPFSSLKLKLHGIVYLSNQESYAMISEKGAIQEIVSVNSEISEGLYLTKIEIRQIEVDYFGERHILLIQNNRIDQGRLLADENEQSSNFNFEKEIELLEVDKQRNPIRLFMISRPYAVYSNGVFQGYKIMPGSNTDQFKRLGFQSGDIITYLNGVEFTGPGKKEFVIQQLTHSIHIDLTVLRGNQELTINYGF